MHEIPPVKSHGLAGKHRSAEHILEMSGEASTDIGLGEMLKDYTE